MAWFIFVAEDDSAHCLDLQGTVRLSHVLTLPLIDCSLDALLVAKSFSSFVFKKWQYLDSSIFGCCSVATRQHQIPHSLGSRWSKWPSPFVLSRASCRPRFLPGLRTQWLLVAVTSNTSHPSSAAQMTRESSMNRSDSLDEKSRYYTHHYKGQVKASVNSSDRNTEQGSGVERVSQRSVTEWSKKRDEARK